MITQIEIEKYITEKRANNLITSVNTEIHYKFKLNEWLKFCQGDDSIENALKYRDFLTFRCKDSIYMQQVLYVLGNFYDFMQKEENPFMSIIKTFKVKKNDIALKQIERNEKALSDEEVQKIINIAKEMIKEKEKHGLKPALFFAQRNYFTLMMLYTFGMRINSLLSIKLEHIDFEKNKIMLYECKTNPYPIPIEPIEQELKLYINQRNQFLASKKIYPPETPEVRFKTRSPKTDNGYLFVIGSGKKLSHLVAREAINDIIKKTNIYKTGKSTHQLRHYRATKNYKYGMPMDLISSIMGVSVKTLKKIYLHVNDDDIIAQYSKWAKTKRGFVCPVCGYSEEVQKEKEIKKQKFQIINGERN